MWFGNRQSPEICVKFYFIAEEIVRGDPFEPDSTLRYDKVFVNAVGTAEFNPALPNVYKWDEVNKKIAGDVISYIDDLWAIGHSTEEAWRIARQVASRLQHLGI